MFKKLFGGSSAKPVEQKVDAIQTMHTLRDQIEINEKRIKKVETDMKNCVTQALEKKKAKDVRGTNYF